HAAAHERPAAPVATGERDRERVVPAALAAVGDRGDEARRRAPEGPGPRDLRAPARDHPHLQDLRRGEADAGARVGVGEVARLLLEDVDLEPGSADRPGADD